jgi:3-isopropylmalate/(R)-2-methylmalate dehydratase small subunit
MNQPFTTHEGVAVPILRDNIDTDQIIPSREMKTVSKLGLGSALFAGQRYLNGRRVNPDFILNRSAFKRASIILSGKNFGCGSSREHAVWALKDFGIRAIIAESYGDIFYKNCIVNGLLPIVADRKNIAGLGETVKLDLLAQKFENHYFDIAENDKTMLVQGLDAIAITEEYIGEIKTFLEKDKLKRSWVYF